MGTVAQMERRLFMARDLNGKHIVIIGATGVLGGHLATKLVAQGARVSAIVRDATREQTKAFELLSDSASGICHGWSEPRTLCHLSRFGNLYAKSLLRRSRVLRRSY